MVQIAGHFLAYVSYGPCEKEPHDCAPIGWVMDLRYDRYPDQGTGEWGTVKVRVNERGSYARIVRVDPDRTEAYWPPDEGPYRVEVYDRNEGRTVDSGPGIDPLSLTMKGRLVTWLHDGQRKTTTVRDWPRPGRPHGVPGSGF